GIMFHYFILVNVMNKELILSLLMPLILRGMSDLNLQQGTRVKLRKEEKLTIMSFLRKEKNEKNGGGGTILGIIDDDCFLDDCFLLPSTIPSHHYRRGLGVLLVAFLLAVPAALLPLALLLPSFPFSLFRAATLPISRVVFPIYFQSQHYIVVVLWGYSNLLIVIRDCGSKAFHYKNIFPAGQLVFSSRGGLSTYTVCLASIFFVVHVKSKFRYNVVANNKKRRTYLSDCHCFCCEKTVKRKIIRAD
uniref:Uncharacterized protein n=1 Tax=Meloidogyne incognita TaxID=6306 RepID=A0A914NV06_MELIC